MSQKMPFLMVGMMFVITLCHGLIPLSIQEVLYGLSLSIKSLIIFSLPFIIFGMLFKSVIDLMQQATYLLGLALGAVCISNFIATLFGYYAGQWIYHFDFSFAMPEASSALKARWVFYFPRLLKNHQAMCVALVGGLVLRKWNSEQAKRLAEKVARGVEVMLQLLTYLIPIFVAGFIIKLQAEGIVYRIIQNYARIFFMILVAQFVYVGGIYLISNKFQLGATCKHLRDMLPATISGFSTMSSAASMPLTIWGVENNVKHPAIARTIIPLTVNIHLIGDCIAIPCLAYAVLKSYGVVAPSLSDYLPFAVYFVIAKFSVAAIPGGGIFVMLPILEYYLGFTSPMLSLITSLYILFDPIITSINILGNGAFAKIIDQLMAFKKREK